jgi:hypothetical protein
LFISYAHDDGNIWLDLFRKHLASFELDLWDDTRINQGEHWPDKIEGAINDSDLALLLVTPGFIASSFIQRNEVPVLWERYSGSSCLFWVHCSTANWETTILKPIQAAHDVGSPLSCLEKADRERAVKAIASKLCKAARPDTNPGSPATGESRELTIRLETEPDGSGLHVSYFRREYGERALLKVQLRDSHLLKELRSIVRTPNAFSRSGPFLENPRERLFQLLFPEGTWKNLRLFGDDVPPSRYALHTRVWVTDPELASLPWLLTSHAGMRLVNEGWTFEVVAKRAPEQDVDLPAPCRFMAAVQGKPFARHEAELQEILKGISPYRTASEYYSSASSGPEFEARIRGFRPHILYCCAPACAAEASELRFELGASWLGLSDLSGIFERAKWIPSLVILNLLLPEGQVAIVEPARFGRLARAVIVNRWPMESGDAETAGRRWLRNCLRDGLDPVSALRGLGELAAAYSVVTEYGRWATLPEPPSRPPPQEPKDLDRGAQRAFVEHHVRELVHSRRVEAIIAFGERGNLVEKFSEQALASLAKADIVTTRPIRLVFPDTRPMPPGELKNELLRRLELLSEETLWHGIGRAAPKARGRTPLLWLDWGVLGGKHGRSAKSEDLRHWLTFSSELVKDCPDGIRIVSYLGVETESSKHPILIDLIEQSGTRLVEKDRRFWYTLLGPLREVPFLELLHFLSDGATCSCPDPPRAARLIDKYTHGQYEATYDIIKRAEFTDWLPVLREIESRIEPPVPPGSGPETEPPDTPEIEF